MTPPPVLSLITWSPFVGALLIMFTARHRPLAVRLIAVATTGVSMVGALWLYIVYDREAAGFQFYEKFPLVPRSASPTSSAWTVSACSWCC